MEPNMAPFIAVAWVLSFVSLGGLTAWSWRQYQRRGR